MTAVNANNVRRQKYKLGATPFAIASYLLYPKPLRPQFLPPRHPRLLQILHLQLATHLPALRPLPQSPLLPPPQPFPLLRHPHLQHWRASELVLTEQHGGNYPSTLRMRIEDLRLRLYPSSFSQWQLWSWPSGVPICDCGRKRPLLSCVRFFARIYTKSTRQVVRGVGPDEWFALVTLVRISPVARHPRRPLLTGALGSYRRCDCGSYCR